MCGLSIHILVLRYLLFAAQKICYGHIVPIGELLQLYQFVAGRQQNCGAREAPTSLEGDIQQRLHDVRVKIDPLKARLVEDLICPAESLIPLLDHFLSHKHYLLNAR